MPAIPSALSQRLRETLVQHPALDSDRALRAVFVDTRLALWRDRAPENTTDRANRVAALIDALYDQINADGKNALTLFLHTLADQTNTTDALHPVLLDLAAELAAQPSITSTLLSFSPEAEGETLIVIAAFYHSAGVIDTQPHNKIRRAIEKARKETDFANLRVAVDPTPLNADDRAGASALGDLYDASLVIWGEDTGVEVCVNFYNRKHPDFAAAVVRIEETERTQIAAGSEYAKFITKDLPAQLTFLSLFTVGQSYYAAEAYSDSAQAIEAAVTYLGPFPMIVGAADAYFRLGWLYGDPLLDTDKALANYTQAIALDPSYTKAYNNRGSIYRMILNYAAALADFERAIELDPKTITYYNRGLTYDDMQNYAAALADFECAIKLDPQYVAAYNNRGLVYYHMQDYAAALADYERAIKLDPQYVAAYNNRGLTYYAMQDYVAALADYGRAIKLDPQYAIAYNNRGLTYYDMQDYAAALADYERAIELDPQCANAYDNRGSIYEMLQDYEAALADFGRAIELDPQNAIAYYNRGITYYDMRDYAAALADYGRAIELAPQDAAAHYNRGNTYRMLQDYIAALADYGRAIELAPQDADAYYSRGNTFKAMQNYEAAIADYERALELNPQHTGVYNSRGNIYQALQKYAAALVDYKRAIALNPQYAKAYYNGAAAYSRLRHIAEAYAWLERAITLNAEFRDKARTDTAFNPIRSTPSFQALMSDD